MLLSIDSPFERWHFAQTLEVPTPPFYFLTNRPGAQPDQKKSAIMTMDLYQIPVSWIMRGIIRIPAASKAEAICIASKSPLPKGQYDTGSFEIFYDEIEAHLLLDKNGKQIRPGCSVSVPDPIETDIHTHSFQATVFGCRNGLIVVADAEDQFYDIEAHRLEITDE